MPYPSQSSCSPLSHCCLAMRLLLDSRHLLTSALGSSILWIAHLLPSMSSLPIPAFHPSSKDSAPLSSTWMHECLLSRVSVFPYLALHPLFPVVGTPISSLPVVCRACYEAFRSYVPLISLMRYIYHLLVGGWFALCRADRA